MKPRHKVSSAALELVKAHEGLRARAARLPDGRWTVGYGHTASAREGVEVSAHDAESLLLYDMRAVAAAVNAWTFAPLTQNQFDALCAFAFNVGLPAFRGSNVLRRVNEGQPLQAASALDSWRRAEFEGEPQIIDALVRRRAAEKALFLTPPDGPVVAPTPVLTPTLDYTVAPLAEEPLELTVPLDGEATPVRAAAPAERVDVDAPPSAASQAADSVSRRLRAMFPDDGEAAPPVESAPTPETVAPVLLGESRGAVDPARQLAPPSPVGPTDERTLADVPPDTPVAERADRWPYLFLFLGGAVLFVAGVSASMRADGGSALGWTLGLSGVVCMAVAVYFLLKRLDTEE